jgi:hypothetical protein
MSIKNVPIGKNSKYLQSYYRPENPEKYIGDIGQIICRSSWEKQFCNYCDNNSMIIKWGSEVTEIPYVDADGKTHRYYPDFYLEMHAPELPTMMRRVVVEIKPEKETIPPVIPENVTARSNKRILYELQTYNKNIHKWMFAIDWCKRRDLEFWIVTEHTLKALRLM